ncbi:MAG TPA: NfeD family protein [Candidatus Polarisedimenticolaceae bacterium]
MTRFLLAFASAGVVYATAASAAPTVRLVPFGTEVTHATANRIYDAIDAAAASGDALILVELDTPGGDVRALESIVQRMLASKTPICVWVGPAGARAASAGFLMLLAADVAAMAPGTRTGAASVIRGVGPNPEDDVALKKMTKDFAGLARSIAEHRGRDVAKAEQAVMSAEVYTDAVASASGLVEIVAKDRAELLAKLDGREITRFDGTRARLDLAGAAVVEVERTGWQRIVEELASPTVALILFLVGIGGLWFEFQNPGGWVPGVVGAVSLLLFALAANMLPFSFVGLLLVAGGLACFVLEVKVVSHGLLTAAGVACLGVGIWMMFPGPVPELRVPLLVLLPAVLALGAFCALAVRLAAAAQRAPLATGAEGLEGEVGTVERALVPEGRVFVHGELWDAVSAAGHVPAGRRVRVEKVESMVLHVRPLDGRASGEVA